MVFSLVIDLFLGVLVSAWPLNVDDLLGVSMRVGWSFISFFLRFLLFLQLFQLNFVCLSDMALSVNRLEVLNQINWVRIAVTRIWLTRQSYALNEWL